MTLPVWPSDVPHIPLRDTVQIVSNQPPLRTSMDGGNARMRPQVTLVRSTLAFSIRMTSTQLASFKTFWKTDLGQGSSRFTMDVWGPDGCVEKTCQASDGTFKATPTGGGWIIALQIDVEDY